jgi:diaminopimelate epimerase
MSISFLKASACGNDFLIIDGALAPHDVAAFTRRICDRQNGVGADGVEWLYPAPGVDIEARLINADGSAAEISGNGTRCVAAYLCSERRNESFLIRTGAGDKLCNLTSQSGHRYEFETAMGKPQVEKARSLRIHSESISGIDVSMGNPHFVVFVETFARDWQARAAEIQHDPSFTQGVNIEFVQVRDPHHIEVRFYERGVGETLSSGTGSSAAAAAAIASNRAQSPVRVEAAGGSQFVRWEAQLYLRGSADLICRGEFFE